MAYRYGKTVRGRFVSHPNRFIANVEIDGEIHVCHVKNTGRCRELLVEGCTVILEEGTNPARKTKYDLIAVYKGGKLINMDSQVPNKCAAEYIPALFDGVRLVKPEFKYGASRVDFYIETEKERILLEVKGVTLENDGIVKFPDAPTERGVKHLNELKNALDDGFKAAVMFVIQMDGVKLFMPNDETHPQFGQALREAEKSGVKVIACQCAVTEDTIEITSPVKIQL